MTQFTAIYQFALVAVWARLISEIKDDVMRRSERLIEDCGDLQVISHVTLSIIRAEDDFFDSVRDVLISLNSLKRVMEWWYESVTYIFHDSLVDAFSRWLYKSVHRMLDEFK
jgi:hypothetical protein